MIVCVFWLGLVLIWFGVMSDSSYESLTCCLQFTFTCFVFTNKIGFEYIVSLKVVSNHLQLLDFAFQISIKQTKFYKIEPRLKLSSVRQNTFYTHSSIQTDKIDLYLPPRSNRSITILPLEESIKK